MVTNTSYKMWPELCPLLKTLLFLLCIYLKRVSANCGPDTSESPCEISATEPIRDDGIRVSLSKLGANVNQGLNCDEVHVFDDMTDIEIPCNLRSSIRHRIPSSKKYRRESTSVVDPAPSIDEIVKKVSVIWLKNGFILHRENGNPLLSDQFNTELGNLFLHRPGVSDAGRYTCLFNFSLVSKEESKKFCLFPATTVNVNIESRELLSPDIEPIINYPPTDKYVRRGDNHTFECTTRQTLTTQNTYWFKSEPPSNLTDQRKFMEAFEKSKISHDKSAIKKYIIHQYDNQISITLRNISDKDLGYYGCIVENHRGVDTRLARLDFFENFELTANHSQSTPPSAPNETSNFIDQPRDGDLTPSDPRMAYSIVEQTSSTTILACIMIAVLVTILFALYVSKRIAERSDRKDDPESLLSKSRSKTNKGRKEANLRQHLPDGNLPNIYDTKTSDGFICGHLHQGNGHLMTQSICEQMLYKNPSISSNSSGSTDEASTWGKSLSPHRDSSRAFYLHTSNTTATTVPMYDHPPSSGISHILGSTLVRDSCVINPTYGFLLPECDTTHWAFPRRNLERVDEIGKGEFGKVWRYFARQKDGCGGFVAVKKQRHDSILNDREGFGLLEEIEIMKLVNEHPNVIKLLGHCKDMCEPTLLIMEYAENGDLRSYFRKCLRDDGGPKGNNITSKTLMKFSLEIAEGMAYVASKEIIHRDLAARNILVSKEGNCKVGDFGFARRVGAECAYEMTSTHPVPIRWMAPESLIGKKFTFKSDIFSYGVLLWEIITLGATPYWQLSSLEVISKVTSGGRLERPKHCKDEFYNIMEECWIHDDPNKRPTFRQIACRIEKLLLSENNYIELDQYPSHTYYNLISAEDEDARM